MAAARNSAAARQSRDAEPPAAVAQAVAPHHPIACQPADPVRRGPDHVSERGQHERSFGEAAALHQIRLQPRLEESQRIHITGANGCDAPQRRHAQRRGPWQAVRLHRRSGTDFAEFGLGDPGLLVRRIPKPRVPGQAPDDADEAEHEEGRPPAVTHLNRDDEQRRQGGADLTGHPHGAPGAGALGDRHPAADHRGRIGVGTGLARAKTEPHQQQDGVIRHRPRERREGRPPDDDPRQNAAWADAIAQRSARDFEGAVRQKEDAGNPAPRLGTDVQSVLHARAGDGDADAVQVGDDGEQRQHAEHPVLIFHATSSAPQPRSTTDAKRRWQSIRGISELAQARHSTTSRTQRVRPLDRR